MSGHLEDLARVIQSRRGADPERSYTAKLLADPELAQRKIMEEAFEVCLELGRSDINADLVANEAADLVYHLMTGMASVGVEPSTFLAVLEERRR
ncbi:MAG: phosphoribosyl-ATP diphosphatase [Acidimicrobiales bacterium]|nr:phosphoribosyl-ATP diphosphatase [Acidimicrobiales bacterium]